MIVVKNKNNCMGCCACSNICPNNCITMQSDMEGFWYPKIDDNSCIKCGQCNKVCPIINPIKIQNNPRAYACLNLDETIRLASSSGGIFTLLAETIINNDGIVYGAEFIENFEVKHSYIEKKEDIEKLRGSKYAQSKIGDSYRQVKVFLDKERQVLFTGTPCQIGGLKAYLGQVYDNLFCVDIICHGVPSPKVWKRYILYREKAAGESLTKKIAFRLKDEGWKRSSVLFLFENNTKYQQTVDNDLYMNTFLKDICLRPSCYHCKYKTLNRQSDITLADFWGIENVLPEMDDGKGTSLIFVNSTKGQQMFESIKEMTKYQEVDINHAARYNPSAIRSAKCNSRRDNFFRELNEVDFDELVKKCCSNSIPLRMKLKFKSATLIVLDKLRLLNVLRRILRKV